MEISGDCGILEYKNKCRHGRKTERGKERVPILEYNN